MVNIIFTDLIAYTEIAEFVGQIRAPDLLQWVRNLKMVVITHKWLENIEGLDVCKHRNEQTCGLLDVRREREW